MSSGCQYSSRESSSQLHALYSLGIILLGIPRLLCQWISAVMTAQIHTFLALQSSGLSCPFDLLGSISPASGLSGPVSTSYSCGPYLRVFRLVSKWYVLLPRLGLSGTCNHASISKGDATVGALAKVSNQLSSGCLGMANCVRAVTPFPSKT